MQDGLLRVLAPNPSPMTEAGTNSYVLGAGRDVAVVDPGPDDSAHRTALMAAVAGRTVRAIVVTHPHLDHSQGAAALGRATGARVHAFGPAGTGRSATMRQLARTAPALAGGEGVDGAFRPDVALADGATLSGDGWTLRAHWTPGHMSPHLTLVWREGDAAFTGDTVMGWASTMISPPDGDVGQFLSSMDRMAGLGVARFLPGHGAPVEDPAARCRDLRDHRLAREAAILAAIPSGGGRGGGTDIAGIVGTVYGDTPAALRPAAARNVLAHLIRLVEHGRVRADRLAPDGTYVRT